MDGEREILAAVVARLLPLGPGTPESSTSGGAPVVDHIQEVLRGPHYAPARERIEAALARLDALARERHGAPFAALDDGARDDALRALEREGVQGGESAEPARLLFRLLTTFTLEASLRSPELGGEPARRARAHMGLPEPRAAGGDGTCRRR